MPSWWRHRQRRLHDFTLAALHEAITDDFLKCHIGGLGAILCRRRLANRRGGRIGAIADENIAPAVRCASNAEHQRGSAASRVLNKAQRRGYAKAGRCIAATSNDHAIGPASVSDGTKTYRAA